MNDTYNAFLDDVEDDDNTEDDDAVQEIRVPISGVNMTPEGLEIGSGALDELIASLPDGLPEGFRDALELTNNVGKLEQNILKSAYGASRFESVANELMMSVSERLGLKPEDFPDGGFAKACLANATPDELVAFSQAMSNAFDLALLAFTESYRIVTLLTHNEKVTVRVGMGELRTVDDGHSESLLKLQPKRDAVRAMILADGLVQLERLHDGEVISDTQFIEMLSTLVKHANTEAKKVALEEGEAEGDLHA